MTIVFNHFADLAAALPRARDVIVKETADDVQADAQNRAPVKTGHLRNSLYVRTPTESGYPGDSNGPITEQCDAPDAGQAYVAAGALYAIFNELGTAHMAARPFLAPAAEAHRQSFIDKWQRLESYLKV